MTELADLSETDADNIDITGANIAEGCNPSDINNAIRNLAGLIKRAFKASNFRIRDTADQTKLLALDLSALATGTTRTLAVPNQSGALVVLDDSNNLNGPGTINATRASTVKSASPAVGPAEFRVVGSGNAILGYFGITGVTSEIEVWNTQAAAINFGTSNTLRAWITSTGAFVLGAPASASGGANGKTLAVDAFESSRNTSGSATHQFYYNPNGTVGTITTSGSATAYNTSSDEALKDFDGEYDAESAATIIRADPVRRFRWKVDGSEAIGWGAQTSYAVSPELATPGNGTPGDADYIPWGIDQSKRTPYLWAAVSGLLDTVDELKARVAQLESQVN